MPWLNLNAAKPVTIEQIENIYLTILIMEWLIYSLPSVDVFSIIDKYIVRIQSVILFRLLTNELTHL